MRGKIDWLMFAVVPLQLMAEFLVGLFQRGLAVPQGEAEQEARP